MTEDPKRRAIEDVIWRDGYRRGMVNGVPIGVIIALVAYVLLR